NITAAKGTNNTYPTSLAVLDKIPAKTITKVKSLFGVANTILLRMVPISPEPSAIPIPNKETKTVPKGAKSVKLVTILLKIKSSPSVETKLTDVISAPVPGCITLISNKLAIQEAITTNNAKLAKSVAV